MLGRNDLCSCGSGKKYKKCCLNKDMVLERTGRKVINSQNQYINLYSKLYDFSRDEKFKEEYEKAKKIFYIMDDENINKKFERFFNTYFIQDHIMENKKVISVEFFEQNKGRFTKNEVDILSSLFESYVSIYEVVAIEDSKVYLKDCLTEKELHTDDVNLLKDFEVGSYMIARIVTVADTSILIDITVSISQAVKDIIVTDLMNSFKQYEEIYKDMKTFLIYRTYILYRYIQQLLEPQIATYLKEQRAIEMQNDEVAMDVDVEVECKVCDMLKQNAQEDADACVAFWNEYKKSHGDVKGSENGWAAAVEYHIKKEAGKTVTQAQISKKYDVSSSTVGKRYKELKIS